MRLNLSKLFALAFALLLCVSCTEDSLENHDPHGDKPTVSFLSATLVDGYTLLVDGRLDSDGGSPLLDLGICYNPIEAGEPSLTNEKSSVFRLADMPAKEFNIRCGLAPNKEYAVRIYAQNRNGLTYTDVRTISTPDVNLDQLLTGTFIAKSHQSYYFMDAPYADYEVTITKGPVFLGVPTYRMAGLKVRPGAREELFEAEFEVITQVTDSGTFYNLVFPAQLTGISREIKVDGKPTRMFNVMMINGRWLTSASELETDMFGYIDASNGFELVLPRGYGFVYSDPFTDELNSDPDSIVDLVLGTITFDEEQETDYRAACRIIKKY